MKQHSKVASKLIGKSARNGKKKKTQDSLRNMRATMKKKTKSLRVKHSLFLSLWHAIESGRTTIFFFTHQHEQSWVYGVGEPPTTFGSTLLFSDVIINWLINNKNGNGFSNNKRDKFSF